MSMRSWTEYGYGFPLYTGKNGLKILDFFAKHRISYFSCHKLDTAVKIYSKLKDLRLSVKDAEDPEENLLNGFEDIFDFHISDEIASIINHENRINGFRGFQADGDTGAEDTVMYTLSYPWQLTEKERSLSEKDLMSICEYYAAELGIPTDSIDYQNLEYYG